MRPSKCPDWVEAFKAMNYRLKKSKYVLSFKQNLAPQMVVVKATTVISKKLRWLPLRNLGAAPPLIAEATNKAPSWRDLGGEGGGIHDKW